MLKQPEVTTKPVDPLADLNRGISIASPSSSSSSEPSAAPASSSNGSNAEPDGGGAAAVATGASPSVDPLEASRQTKLGLLLVELGGVPEERVFGSRDSAAMRAYREHRVPDLLVINRPEDDAAAHPLVWYKPWTWWSAGPQVSPMRWSSEPGTGPAAAKETKAIGTEDAATATEATGPVESSESLLLKAADAAVAERKKRKKKSGLPPVIMTPLSEDDVQGKLTEQVRQDREKLLTSEERIHKVLQGIEDTRYKYLVPSQELSCERQVLDVVTCYERRNAEAEKKRAAITQKRKEEIAKGFSNQIDDVDVDAPIVLFDALACGAKVEALKKCTAAMVASYSEGEIN